MPEADAEYRNVGIEEFADRCDGVVARLRVAGTVGEEDAVGIERERIRRARLRGHDRHPAAVVGQQPQDIALDAEVVRHDVQSRTRPQHARRFAADAALVPLVGRPHRHDLREIHSLEPGKGARSAKRHIGVGLVGGRDATALGAALAEDTGELAGVDAGDCDRFALDQELRQRMARAPARIQERQVADDESRGMDRIRLQVLGRDAGVADVRIGERDDLAGIGRVGQDFLVARHRRVEDDLAGRDAGSADRNSPKHRAVLEREHCRCRCHQGVLPVPRRRLPARGAGPQWMEPSGTPPVIVVLGQGAATRGGILHEREGQSSQEGTVPFARSAKGTVPGAVL